MVKCPNKNHPEWKELERLLPNQAYVVWDAFPHGIDKAPNGADSKLFKDLLEHYEGDRDSAIKAKAKTVTNAFKTWFGDWTKVSKVKYDTLSESDIVFGHPGIGKTYSFENGKFKDKFIDWDVEYNSKRDKWIEEHSGTKKGTAEYKKARNEYLIYPERHSDYVEFLTNEWNRVKEKAKKEGKILFASPHTLLKLFPQDFTRIINLSDEDFIKRDINRGGKRIESRLWKNAINDTISGIKNIPIDTLQEGEYLEDYLSSNKESKPAQSNAVEKAKEEYIQEMKGILAKAPRDSQGRLLAPNGKLSNLTERQYAQVRTKAFKDWFGDWEKANTFNIDTIDTSKVDIEEYDKPWKNVPTKSNKTLRIYIKGQHEKGYFELVKDQEFGIFSIHFKTGNANTGEIYGSTKEERSILYKQLLNALPNGAQLSTWGELSEGGIKALNKLGKNLKKVGERQVKDRQGNSISIPIYQKGEGVSKVVDENGEPLLVYHGTQTKFTEFSKEKRGTYTGATSAKLAFFAASSKLNSGEYAKLEDLMTAIDQLKEAQTFDINLKLEDIGAVDDISDLDIIEEEYFNTITGIQGSYYSLANDYAIYLNSKGESKNIKQTLTVNQAEEWVTDKDLNDYKNDGFIITPKQQEDYKRGESIEIVKSTTTPLDGYDVFKRFKENNEFTKAHKEEINRYFNDIKEVDKKYEQSRKEFIASKIETTPYILSLFLNIKNPKIDDDKGKGYRAISYAKRISDALQEGKDGGVIKNTKDPYDTDVYYFFEPNQAELATDKEWFGDWTVAATGVDESVEDSGNEKLSKIKYDTLSAYADSNTANGRLIGILLDKYISESDIKEINFVKYGASGSYNAATKNLNIPVSNDAPLQVRRKIIAHELLHVATGKYCFAYENLKDGLKDYNASDEFINELPKLSKDQIEAFEELSNIKRQVVNYINDNQNIVSEISKKYKEYQINIRYFMDDGNPYNLHEFLSEVFSNPALIELLTNIKSNKNNTSTLFEKFVQTLSKIFGIDVSTTLFGDVVTELNKIIGKNNSNSVSKVVDENGEPMIVWHGTKYSFEEFELDTDNKRGKHLVHVNKGFFFTDSKKKALKYKNSNVIPAFLSAKNPGKSSVVEDGVVNNVDKENKILLDDTYDSAIFIRFDKEGDEFGTKPTTQYVAKRPNQIKSIDNTGEFGETGNIFYKIMESVNKAEKELFNDRSIYNQRFYEKFKTFTDSSSAIKFLLDNGYIQEEYVKLAELLMAHSVKLSVSKDFVNNGKLGSYIPGMKKGESSIELTKDTFTKRPDITAEVLLHEVMHHYLGYRYDMDAEFKKRVDMLHKKYTSLATENEKKSFYGLSEGKEEFLIEAVTNSELRNWMQRKDKELESSLYNRLKRLIAKALLLLGVHNANAYNLNDITGAITHMVENISKREAPLSERKYSKSEAIRRFGGLDINHVQNKKDSDYIRTMEQEAGVTRVRIEQGIKSRIKAFEQYGKATYNQVRVMEQELANLQELWQKNEDKEAMLRFINHAAREADKPIRAIDAAFEEYKATGKFSLRNNQLVQIYRDFIGFYEPVIENINEKLFTIGYFDDLSDTEYEFLGNSIGAVTQDFSRIKSKYSALLANRFGDIIIEAAKEYKMDEAVIRAYVQDHKNYTSEDISWFHTYVGDMKVTKDKTLNLIARKIADLKNEIDRQTVSKASEVLPVFQAVSGSKWQLLYEKDDKGKKTGYLVRDRKYGKFYAERDAYFDSLGEAPIGDKEALREWYAKRNEWLKEHSERRYKPEYYDLFNNMSFAAREARDKIQFEISSTLSKYMDVKGNVHVERISEDDWNKLQVMYQEKRRLSNTYNNDGSKKTGIDLDIAEELQVINEELNKNLSYKSNKERFEKVRAEKEASLSKEDYDRWYKRSTRWAYTEEFQKLLDSIDKRDYGLENPLYAELNEEKKELTKMYRNTHDFMINTKLMPESVKKRIVEIDNILEEIRSKAERRKKEGLTFDKIAKIVYSNYYYAEKQHAIDMDEKNPGYYEKWRNESHTINKKGKLVPHSYYNLMIPNDSKHMEFVPSREFTEIDPESPYWNDQYDINNPEPYQPKKSLYDNSEAYNKVMNDPKLKAIHEVVVNTMAEANEKISFLKRGNNYKLPQITGGAWAFIKANRGIVKGMNRFVRDKYFEDRDDDVDFNYQSYAPDGQPLDTIPTHYMRMLDDPSTITSNLAGALMAYYNMAVNFEKKQQVLPEIKIVQNQVKTRQVQPNWIESKLDRYTTYTPNTQSRASKRLDRFLETNIFGNKYNSIRVGKFNIVKALVGLKNYATLVNLGANIFVAAANVMGSAHQHFTEALTGVYYTPRTALIALRNSLYHMSSMLLHAGKTTHSDKLLSLMNMNQIARENSNMYKRLNYNRFARFLMNHLWYGMMTAGDVFTKGQILTSVYLNTKYVPEHDRFMMRDEYLMLHRDDKKAGKKFSKLNTMNLYDMYEASGINAVLKTGEKYERYHKYITPDLTNRVTNVTRYLAQRADGMMDDSSRNFAQANAVTGFVFMHKNFILSAVEDRVIKATEYNFMLERVDEAQYRTVARRIKETVKYLWQFNKYYYYVFRKRAGVEKPTLRKTEFYENYNMKRVKIESSLVIAYMFISMLLNSYRGDDDKWWMQAIKYAHDRATYEAGNLYNPMDLFNTFKALSPAASSLENAKTVALAITALLDSDSNIFKETKYGPYSGFRRVTKAAFKTTPLKNVIEATDPKSKHKYLKGQLQ